MFLPIPPDPSSNSRLSSWWSRGVLSTCLLGHIALVSVSSVVGGFTTSTTTTFFAGGGCSFSNHRRKPPSSPSSSLVSPRPTAVFMSSGTKRSDDNEQGGGSTIEGENKENKAMKFLRKIGKVGGAANVNFVNAIGVDEGPAGKASGGRGRLGVLKKAKTAYQECTASGIIDDMTEKFPLTSSGCQWAGITDRVMGGLSGGTLTREEVSGRMSNVLRGNVSLKNNGGFVQMATDLSLDPSRSVTVDASQYDGIELDVYCDGEEEEEKFNVHLRNPNCIRQFSSYRATFPLKKGGWETIRVPFTSFVGHGPGADSAPLDISALRRIGVVAIGKEMQVFLALAGIRFYSTAASSATA